MNILFRVDSSIEMGTGHVMRCLTLAKQLKNSAASICFVCRDLEGNINSVIEKNGFQVKLLKKETRNYSLDGYKKWLGVPWERDVQDTINIIEDLKVHPDLLIVDHYAIDKCWEKSIKQYVRNIFVIDDLANRQHECDFLLDQNYYNNADDRYKGLVSNKTKLLLGPEYALLRNEFYSEKQNLIHKDFNNISSILIFMGGTDPDNVTQFVLESLIDLDPMFQLKVVVGKNNPHKKEIKRLIDGLSNANYFEQVSNMATLMANSDLAIGAGGTTTWERCILGVPSLTITVAENQVQMTKDAAAYGAIWYLGHKDELTKERIKRTIKKITPRELKHKHVKSLSLMSQNVETRINDILKVELCKG